MDAYTGKSPSRQQRPHNCWGRCGPHSRFPNTRGSLLVNSALRPCELCIQCLWFVPGRLNSDVFCVGNTYANAVVEGGWMPSSSAFALLCTITRERMPCYGGRNEQRMPPSRSLRTVMASTRARAPCYWESASRDHNDPNNDPQQ